MSNKIMMSKKRCKAIFKQINEDDPDRKINEKFAEKCYFYNLPLNWNDEYKYLNVDEHKKTKLNNIYNTVKQQLSNRSISICDILKITGITYNERLELIEEYAFMQSYDTDIREYTRLREQLRRKMNYFNDRNIDHNELVAKDKKKAKLSHVNISKNEMEDKILNMQCDEYTQALIYQKYLKLIGMTSSDNEYHKLHEWLNFVVNIPFNISKEIKINTEENIASYIRSNLDKELYGMDNVKEEIILFVRQKLKNPESSNLSLALAGPPGVGKTKIIRTLSNILNIPFEHISMGGVDDVSYLNGELYVYEGSKPGKILSTACKLGCNNGIIFFDEIDKIDNSYKGSKVSSKMIHITDFTQNDKYADDYCPELNFGLDKFWFIFSLNDINNVHPILKDRMYIINVQGYDLKQKKEIVKQHIIPKVIKRYDLNNNDINITDEVITFIINKANDGKGVRELERIIEIIYRKLDILCELYRNNDNDTKMSFRIKDFKLPYTLTILDIKTLTAGYEEKKDIPGLYL
jgi:ATP-dependent Lon protease